MDVKHRKATVDTAAETGGPVLLVPFTVGWYSHHPGDYLVHFGGGEMRGLTVDGFQRTYEPHVLDDPSLCSCLNPQVYGSGEGWSEPLDWDPDCKTCGRPLTEQALATAKAY